MESDKRIEPIPVTSQITQDSEKSQIRRFSSFIKEEIFCYKNREMPDIKTIKLYGSYLTFGLFFFFVGLDYAIHLSGMYDYFIVRYLFDYSL